MFGPAGSSSELGTADRAERAGMVLDAAAPNPAYYLWDFHHVLTGVERLYSGLLNQNELGFIRTLRNLSRQAQLLYARLANRRGPYFRRSLLAYPEIGALDAPVDELLAAGLLEICLTLPPAERRERLLACFTLAELREAAQLCPTSRGGRTALLEWLGAWEGLAGWTSGLLHRHKVLGLPHAACWPFLRFLFFGELRPNLSDFVVRALGHVVTESIAAENLRPCFASRAQAEDAYRLACLYQRFKEIREKCAATALLSWWQGQGVDRRRLTDGHAWFDRLVDRLGRRLEREGAEEAALAVYATSPVAPARERQARLLIKAHRETEAIALLRDMQADPCNPQEPYAARQLLARVEKRARRKGRQLQQASRTIVLNYAPRSASAGVEAAALDYYRALGWHGVHAENWLWNASFGLLLWDIIYDPEIGGFHSPLQFAPSDLFTPEFYGRRQSAIEARLRLLRQPAEATRLIARHFEAKKGLANPFVTWHDDVPETLAVMLRRVPPEGHAAVLRRMARNLRHHAHGFLDLFIWKDDDYRFIEIKSENDQLAAHQFEWLRFFAAAGINVSLEKVRRPPRRKEAAGG